ELAFLTAGPGVAFLGACDRQSVRPPMPRGQATARKLGIDRRGRWLAVGWDDGHIDLHDVRTGDRRQSLDRKWWDFALSPDGRWLALQGRDGPIELVPTGGHGLPFTLGQGRGYFPALAFSPDGAILAGVDGRNVTLWDLASKQAVLSLG